MTNKEKENLKKIVQRLLPNVVNFYSDLVSVMSFTKKQNFNGTCPSNGPSLCSVGRGSITLNSIQLLEDKKKKKIIMMMMMMMMVVVVVEHL